MVVTAECNSPDRAAEPLPAAARRAIMAALRAQNPHPRPALRFNTPFELLVAVVLSAQTTDAAVNAVTPGLFAAAPDAAALAALGEAQVGAYIRRLGLWRTKAARLIRLAQDLCRLHAGRVPADATALQALPGVGPKTAAVVLNVAFGQPLIAVDTHVFRVCVRTGLCPGRDALQVQSKLPALIPDEFRLQAHHYLLWHGRRICRARRPACAGCAVRCWCRTANAASAAPSSIARGKPARASPPRLDR